MILFYDSGCTLKSIVHTNNISIPQRGGGLVVSIPEQDFAVSPSVSDNPWNASNGLFYTHALTPFPVIRKFSLNSDIYEVSQPLVAGGNLAYSGAPQSQAVQFILQVTPYAIRLVCRFADQNNGGAYGDKLLYAAGNFNEDEVLYQYVQSFDPNITAGGSLDAIFPNITANVNHATIDGDLFPAVIYPNSSSPALGHWGSSLHLNATYADGAYNVNYEIRMKPLSDHQSMAGAFGGFMALDLGAHYCLASSLSPGESERRCSACLPTFAWANPGTQSSDEVAAMNHFVELYSYRDNLSDNNAVSNLTGGDRYVSR